MKNQYEVRDEFIVIKMKCLGEQVECLVDVEDLPKLLQYDVSWHGTVTCGITYARAAWKKPDGKRTSIHMHRLLMNPEKGNVIDHVNGNGLDNRKSNLRVVTHKENMQNRRMLHTNKSGYTGVYWSKDHSKWRAETHFDGKNKFLGYFDSAEKAYEAVVAFKKVYMPYLAEIGKLEGS